MELLQGKHLKTVASKGRRGDALQGWRGAIVGGVPKLAVAVRVQARRGDLLTAPKLSRDPTLAI